MLISRPGRPINTTSRILLILPPSIGHHEEFSESVYLVKRLAENLGVGLEVIADGAWPPARKYEPLINLVDPQMEVTMTSVGDWEALWSWLRDAEGDVLVIPLKAREGGIGWSPHLRQLPTRLVKMSPESFVVVTPRRGEPDYAARFFSID
ncbi:hypothetical protein [Haloprofundus salilacus]|uniref:hypothetical protein n=1 Tax=Haloprofundus salilacus TaxID=2876190 RepID=UPI001CCE8DBA|nr:hypothetical protein [Haloprofundus salilacus]